MNLVNFEQKPEINNFQIHFPIYVQNLKIYNYNAVLNNNQKEKYTKKVLI